MKYPLQLTLLNLLIISLASCAYQPPKDINSSYYAPPVGSKLQLHSALIIPANDTQVRIQDGKVIHSSWDLDFYYPNCDFELYERAEVKREVTPDTFVISRVVRGFEDVLLHTPTVIASSSGGGGAPNVDYMTIMDLYSPRQPDVFRLTCQHWEDPSDSYHLSIKQIRKTLGDLFTLTLADS